MNIIETNLQFKGNMSVRKSTTIIMLHHAAASVCDAKQFMNGTLEGDSVE